MEPSSTYHFRCPPNCPGRKLLICHAICTQYKQDVEESKKRQDYLKSLDPLKDYTAERKEKVEEKIARHKQKRERYYRRQKS